MIVYMKILINPLGPGICCLRGWRQDDVIEYGFYAPRIAGGF